MVEHPATRQVRVAGGDRDEDVPVLGQGPGRLAVAGQLW
ncbi:hypothetical protein J3R03_004130 [Actinoplanes couchii]|nr:hypothetical protein [Actinoplanes couchii]